jgi:membrane protein
MTSIALANWVRAITIISMRIPRKLGRRLWQAHLGFQDHEGVLSSAGIAYYVALSFFPLMLVMVAGLGSLLAWTQVGQEAQQELISTIAHQASPDLAQQVQRSLDAVKEKAPASGPIGFVALVISALAIFAQLDTAFDRIWRQPLDPHATWVHWVQKLLYQRLKALGMLMGVGGFILLVMVTSMTWAAVEQKLEQVLSQRIEVELAPWFHWASSSWINLLLNWMAFTMI